MTSKWVYANWRDEETGELEAAPSYKDRMGAWWKAGESSDGYPSILRASGAPESYASAVGEAGSQAPAKAMHGREDYISGFMARLSMDICALIQAQRTPNAVLENLLRTIMAKLDGQSPTAERFNWQPPTVRTATPPVFKTPAITCKDGDGRS